jgi:SulP family sulfate permease
LPGVIAGLLIAVVLFAVIYSRIDVVKHVLTGATVKSRMTRGYAKQELLRGLGEQIAIFQLQGYIFFGTAHDLFERVRQRTLAADLPRLRFMLLDFRLVPGLDSTAMLSFSKLRQLGESHGLTLVFTQLAPGIRRQFKQALIYEEGALGVRIFPDLDRGLEWCENELLASATPSGDGARTLYAQLARIVPEEGAPVRLETMRGGRAVGELGFYLGRRRTAAVVADETSSVYRITRGDLRRLEHENADAASAFHLIIARLLSERAVHLIDTVDALQR